MTARLPFYLIGYAKDGGAPITREIANGSDLQAAATRAWRTGRYSRVVLASGFQMMTEPPQ